MTQIKINQESDLSTFDHLQRLYTPAAHIKVKVLDQAPQNLFILSKEHHKRVNMISTSLIDIFMARTEEKLKRSKTATNFLRPDTSLTTFQKYTTELVNMLRNESFEPGVATGSESFVESLLNRDSNGTMTWLNDVFLKFFNKDEEILTGILHIISHFEYKDVYPTGQTIAMAGLTNKSIQVKEYAIRSFENWSSPESLDILRGVECGEVWLQEYVSQVIQDLEEELGEYDAVVG